MMKSPHQADARPEYWLGRAKGRIADISDPTEQDIRRVIECMAIVDGLRAGKPLVTIPEYKTVSARVTR